MSFDAPAPAPGPEAASVLARIPAPLPPGGKDVLAPLAEAALAPPRGRVRPPGWLLIAGAGLLAVAGVAGLISWHPWNPPPSAPAALRGTSPTATSVRLAWP